MCEELQDLKLFSFPAFSAHIFGHNKNVKLQRAKKPKLPK